MLHQTCSRVILRYITEAKRSKSKMVADNQFLFNSKGLKCVVLLLLIAWNNIISNSFIVNFRYTLFAYLNIPNCIYFNLSFTIIKCNQIEFKLFFIQCYYGIISLITRIFITKLFYNRNISTLFIHIYAKPFLVTSNVF